MKAREKLLKTSNTLIPFLDSALHGSAERREAAAYVLGELGSAAKDSVPDLLWALRDGREPRGAYWIQDRPEPRATAARALAKIAPHDKRVITALTDALSNDKEVVRQACADALRMMGVEASDAPPNVVPKSRGPEE